MVKFQDVKHMTDEEFFNGNQFSIDAFRKKYRLGEDETYVQGLWRVCTEIASVEESDDLKKYWAERWFDEIYNGWWHPAGSIMQGAGNLNSVSLANCTTLSLGAGDEDVEWDNLESIIRNTAYSVAKSAAHRQGLGVAFDRLRPRGMSIKNSATESEGSVHWMIFIDSIGYRVGQLGRIPAMLFSQHVSHPDIEEFVTVKSDYTKIQNANISVHITNDFYKAVKNDKQWTLKFEIPGYKKGDKVYIDKYSALIDSGLYHKDDKGYYYLSPKDRPYEKFEKTVSAKKLFRLIAENMWKNAEPGIQNIDIAREYSNSDALYDPMGIYDTRITSTNACSEQYLSRDSLCFLASIIASRFSINPEEFDKEFSIISPSINRFLDNSISYELEHNRYATPLQKLANEQLRRTGAGVTDVGGWLFKHNLEYDSEQGADSLELFIKMYNYHLYKSTIELGKEKGNFGAFDKDKIKKSKFIQRMMKEFRDLDFEYMRNVTVSSIAPTGCTIKSTEVITNDGVKTFEQIFRENDIDIDELEKTGEKQWFDLKNPLFVENINGEMQKVTKLYFNGYSVVKKIICDDGIEFTGTAETHKLLVKSKENDGYGMWKTLDEITEYDEIIIENKK